MAQLLDDITWGEPLLPRIDDPQWVAIIRKRGAPVSESELRVASVPWVRELNLWVLTYRSPAFSERLTNVIGMVAAQEASCRYCYGALRAYLKLIGYTEAAIGRIERDLRMSELDPRENASIALCRSLARSRPRPTRSDLVAYGRSGLTPDELRELVFLVCLYGYHNRVTVLAACPPESVVERIGNGPIGYLVGRLLPMLGEFRRRKLLGLMPSAPPPQGLADGPFGEVVAALAGLPAAAVLRDALVGAYAPGGRLGRPCKALMFAIVAVALGCKRSEQMARRVLHGEGFTDTQVDQALASLQCPGLVAAESSLLAWTRDTVHYQSGPIQQATRQLAGQLEADALVEAIGVAALANAVVRMALLLD